MIKITNVRRKPYETFYPIEQMRDVFKALVSLVKFELGFGGITQTTYR